MDVERRLRHKLTAAGLMIVVMLLAIPGTAWAHDVYEEGWTYYSGADCVWTFSELDGASSGGGHYQGRTESWFAGRDIYGNTQNCHNTFQRPRGYLQMQLQTYVYKNNQWKVCAATSVLYNDAATWRRTVNLGPDAHATCGAGLWYALITWGVEVNNGPKPPDGGPMNSGAHYLPT